MKRLFAHDDRFMVQRVRSELDALNIPYMVKNEFAGGAMGEIPWQEAAQEIWLLDDEWYHRAAALTDALLYQPATADDEQDWQCDQCGEVNSGNFAICWQCQYPRNETVSYTDSQPS